MRPTPALFFAAAATLSLLIAGCVAPAGCHFTNHSGEDVRISGIAGEKQEVIGVVRNGGSLRVPTWRWSEVRIESTSKSRRYKTRQPPPECVESHGFGPWARREFRAELQGDGIISVQCSSATDEHKSSPIDTPAVAPPHAN